MVPDAPDDAQKTSPTPDDWDTTPYRTLSSDARQQRLKDLAWVFFRLGTIAFGGPAAHVAMMDDEVVKWRRWMSRETLLDLMGVTNLLPGPNSTELAIHIGYERAGWLGLFVAGSCFILPAMVLVWLLAFLYVQYQTLPQAQWLLYGIKPVIIAIVLQALWKLGKKAAKDWPTKVAGGAATALYFTGLSEIGLLLLIGLAVMVVKNWKHHENSNPTLFVALPELLAQASGVASTAASMSWLGVFGFFLKIGTVLYGSGYVLLAFLQRDLVERCTLQQCLTSQELLDAVAVGQLTPGPVFTTATFVGYLLAGHAGAIAGTIGIFLPAFLLVGLVNPWVHQLRRSPWPSGFLDGVNAASLGLMAGVTYTLAQAALVDWVTVVLTILSAIAVFCFKINSAWLVLAGGLVGLGMAAIGWIG